MSKTLMEKLGLTEKDFKPKTNDNEQRLDDIENALIELAEWLDEVQNG